jgi:hypothetical protein
MGLQWYEKSILYRDAFCALMLHATDGFSMSV